MKADPSGAAEETLMTKLIALRKAGPTCAVKETVVTQPIAPRKADPNAAYKALVVKLITEARARWTDDAKQLVVNPTAISTADPVHEYEVYVVRPDEDKFRQFLTAIYGHDALPRPQKGQLLTKKFWQRERRCNNCEIR